MNQLFHIKTDHSDNGPKMLAWRIGERHAGFCITDPGAKTLYELSFFAVQDWDEKTFSDLLTKYPSLGSAYEHVLVAYEYPQAAMAPVSLAEQDETIFLKNYKSDLSHSQRVSDTIDEKELVTVYGIPRSTHDWMTRKFPSGKYWHQYSVALKRLPGNKQGASVLLDFRPDDFSLIAEKDGNLLIAETFPYSTPDDVLYYLLKTTHAFSLSQHEVQLRLSGLIDKQSSLYKELYQYFANVNFREARWQAPAGEFPAHFFTAFNDLAECVS